MQQWKKKQETSSSCKIPPAPSAGKGWHHNHYKGEMSESSLVSQSKWWAGKFRAERQQLIPGTSLKPEFQMWFRSSWSDEFTEGLNLGTKGRESTYFCLWTNEDAVRFWSQRCWKWLPDPADVRLCFSWQSQLPSGSSVGLRFGELFLQLQPEISLFISGNSWWLNQLNPFSI